MAAPDYRAKREARLAYLLRTRAPGELVTAECRLVLASHRGSHLRAIGWLVRELLIDQRDYYRNRIQWRLHAAARACGLHLLFTADLLDGTVGCWVCDAQSNAAAQDQKTEESK